MKAWSEPEASLSPTTARDSTPLCCSSLWCSVTSQIQVVAFHSLMVPSSDPDTSLPWHCTTAFTPSVWSLSVRTSVHVSEFHTLMHASSEADTSLCWHVASARIVPVWSDSVRSHCQFDGDHTLIVVSHDPDTRMPFTVHSAETASLCSCSSVAFLNEQERQRGSVLLLEVPAFAPVLPQATSAWCSNASMSKVLASGKFRNGCTLITSDR
mmetsp:Transcript_5085/g.7746  ORF Transcript_5085/g.7746 Transcript_5085/m.7746 type:complete len:211 (+) Transcript_5085:795-1427(+)